MKVKKFTASRITLSLALRHLFTCLLAILLVAEARSQVWQDLHINNYTSKNGMPQNSVKSMLMDKNRFLWMATEAGLVRYDGYDFDVYNPSNTSGFSNERLSSIKTLVNGDILVEDVDGNIVSIKNNELKSVHKIQKPRLSGYWMRGGFPDVKFVINADMQNIQGIKSNFDNIYNWYHVIPADTDMFIITGSNEAKLYSTKKGQIIENINTNGFAFTSSFKLDGFIYIIDSIGNYRIFNESKKSFTNPKTIELNRRKIKHEKLIWNFEMNQCFLILENELYRFENNSLGELELIPITNQIPLNCLVSEIIYDKKSKSYFVGTTTKGLYVFRKKSIKAVLSTNTEDVHSNCFYSQVPLDGNRIYAGNGLEIQDGIAFVSEHDLGVGQGEFYFSTKYKDKIYYSIAGILRYYDLKTKSKKVLSHSQRGYFSTYISGDSIYIASTLGIHYIKDDSLYLLAKTGLTGFDQRITTIIQGPQNKLWMASCAGLITYDTKTKEIAFVPEMKDKCVRSIEKIEDLYLFGTYGQGYLVYYNGKFTQFPYDPQGKVEKTHSFHLDKNGLVWMSTNTGLLNTPLEDIKIHLKDSTSIPYYYYYDNQDGILNTEFNGGCQPNHVDLADGHISYPTMEGLVMLIPEQATRDIPNESIFIDEIQINGELSLDKTKIHLLSKSDEVVIHISSPYWGNMKNLQLEYRIKGIQENWKPTEGGGRWIDFANFPHGKYLLEIRNMVSADPDKAIALKIPIEIEPEFYESWGFLVGGIFSGLIVLFGLFKLNSARIIRQNEILEDQVSERTYELETSNQSLNVAVKNLQDKEYKLRESIRIKDKLISIISHDIITPIKFLSIVSNVSSRNSENKTVDPKESEENMKYIGAAAEKIYNNAANILNWIKLQNELIRIAPENIGLYDFVDEVIAPLDSVIDKDSIQMINDVSEEEIIFSDPNILKIILQNILSNAVKYTKTGTIRVMSKTDESGGITITVKDTGMGMPEKIMDKISTIKKQTLKGEFDADDPDTGNQLGYFIIFDFARLIDGDVEIESELGKGTIVKLTLPPPARN